MSRTVVSVEDVGKQYRLGVIGGGTLHGDVSRWWARVRRKPDPFLQIGSAVPTPGANRVVWALREVSLELAAGDVLGIVGRNGAGKSTLLKILSRVTAPTTGIVRMKGRIGSLLEVGTGFHPELTGRENIYLNGAMLGMRKAQIKKRFDEIVEFAEIGQYLDTPVKRYSSGMYVRLAFSVAAHLETEILLVDEVLAVGDAQFQKKCLGKMSDVARGGRTVVFVSHNMGSVNRLCTSGLLLDEGRVVKQGNVLDITALYLRAGGSRSFEREWPDIVTAPGDSVARLRSVRVLQGGVATDTILITEPLVIEAEFWCLEAGRRLMPFFKFFDDQGICLFTSADYASGTRLEALPTGLHWSQCTIPGNTLAEGTVVITAEVNNSGSALEIHLHEREVVSFEVVDRGGSGSVRSRWAGTIPGVMRPQVAWEHDFRGALPEGAAGL